MNPDDPTTQKPSNLPVGNITILIAEDNALIQQTMKLLLSKFKITLTFAGNGKLAVEYMLHEKYDFVLMDINMPEMDGIEATRAIRLFNQQTPIVAFTTQDALSLKQQIQTAGMNDYLSKFATPGEIYETILRYTGAAA